MKTLSAPDTQNSSRAAANTAPVNGVALPAVQQELEAPMEEPLPANETEAATPLQAPVAIDMNDDEEDEPHTLSVQPDNGELWLHSDPVLLSAFLKRKYLVKHQAHRTPKIEGILQLIEANAQIVHEGTYSKEKALSTPRIDSKGKTKTKERKPPTPDEKNAAKAAFNRIVGCLRDLHSASALIMKKLRPPSHKKEWLPHNIDGVTYCGKIVMEPLSIMPRTDGVEGSPPVSASDDFFKKINVYGNYKRGHMLNEHLHGPGVTENLVPISTKFNNMMRESVEKKAKEAVNANNKVVRFEAEPQDWGTYQGAFGEPDERKLPGKFRFLVQQMHLQPGTDGSQITDWVTNGTVFYQQTLVHDRPEDIKRGIIAPGVKTFKEGYYYTFNGKCEPVSGSTSEFHLSAGHYLVNGGTVAYMLEPLGLGTGPYTEETFTLPATTRFELPADCILIQGKLGNKDNKVPIIISDDDDVRYMDIGKNDFIVIKKGIRKNNIEEYMKKITAFKDKRKREGPQGGTVKKPRTDTPTPP